MVWIGWLQATESRSEHNGFLEQQGVYSLDCRGCKRVQTDTIKTEIEKSWEETGASLLGKFKQLKADVYPEMKLYTQTQEGIYPQKRFERFQNF